MKKIIVTFLATLFLATLNYTEAQNLQEVLDKHFVAIGQEKLLDIETYTVNATVKQMGMEIPMILKIKRPNKFIMEIDMQGQKMITAFDGEKGWTINPWINSAPQDLTGPELDQAMDQANIDGELHNYAEKGKTAVLVGKEDVDGQSMFNIKLTGKDGNSKNYFIDANDYLVRKVKAKVSQQGQEFDVEQNMKEYKDFNGIKMIAHIETTSPMGTADIIFKDFKFDENIDDSVFEKP